MAEVISIDELRRKVRSQRDRYKENCKKQGDGIFRGRRSQLEIRSAIPDYFHEKDESGNLHTDGYIVAPPRIGKTIIIGNYIVGINTTLRGEYVLGDKTRGKRVLVCVPTNQLVDQWADKLLGELQPDGTRKPSLFGDNIKPEHVGIYHARPGMTDDEKREILSKPVVIVTDDSVRALVAHTDRETGNPDPLIRGKDFDTVVLDEVDHRLRGDVHKKIFRETFFGNCKVIGMTATPLYKSNLTVGDELFGGKKPICEITHKEAIDRREIAPNATITYEFSVDHVDSDLRVKANNWDDLTDAEKEKFIRQTGSDDTAIKILLKHKNPVTGERLFTLKQLWKGETVAHSKLFAEKLNKALNEAYKTKDKEYAAVVYGNMDPDEYRRIMDKYKTGEIKALVQCKLLGRGFDDDDIGFTGQLGPSQSPNDIIQFFTRADTLNKEKDPSKVAVHLTPRFEGIQQLHIGELLGGQIMIPPGYQYPPTAGKESYPASEPEPWPEIEGVKVYHTVEDMRQLAEKLANIRRIDKLPRKKEDMLGLQDMLKRLDPGITEKELRERVYDPLEEAYGKRKARDKVIAIQTGAKKNNENVIFIDTFRFPVWDMGYCREGQNKELFYIDENQFNVCRQALYGGLVHIEEKPEMLEKRMVQIRLKADDATMDALWGKLREAFFKVKANSHVQHVDIDGVDFAYKDFKFFLNQGFREDPKPRPELYLSPDGLEAAYRYCNRDASKKVVETWLQTPEIKKLKTSQWYTETEALKELNVYGEQAKLVHDIFVDIRNDQDVKKLQVGREEHISSGKGRNAPQLYIAKKFLPFGNRGEKETVCLHADDLEWIKEALHEESRYQATGTGRPRR